MKTILFLFMFFVGVFIVTPNLFAQTEREVLKVIGEEWSRYEGEEPKTIVQAGVIHQAIVEGKDIHIENASIVGELKIIEAKGRIRVTDSKFRDVVHFLSASFSEWTVFSGTTFSKDVPFNYATFSEDVNFRVVKFSGDVDFANATFSKDVQFNYATFSKDVQFSNVTFSGDVDFSNVTFSGDVDFSDATFSKGVDFSGDTLSKLGGRLDLEWKQIKGKLVYNGLTYINLIKKFKEQEQFDDADDAYYSYRVEKRKHEKKWYNPSCLAEFIFLDLTCGYGVRPFRTIVWGIGVIVFFTACYYRVGAIQERRTEQKEPEKSTRWDRFSDALYFSINTFTTVGYGDWYPTEEYVIKRWRFLRFRTLATIEGLLGWMLLALFLVTLGKVWIR